MQESQFEDVANMYEVESLYASVSSLCWVWYKYQPKTSF